MRSKSGFYEASLVQQLKQGDERAYEQAIKYYTPGMIAAARFFLDPDTAEDIVQEAWVTVTKAIKSFEGRSGLSTWLHRIVVNKSLSHLRKPLRELSVEPENLLDPQLTDRFDTFGAWLPTNDSIIRNDLESQLENDELIGCIENFINQLPDQQRSAVILYDLHQQNPEEICQTLNINISNLRVIVHRARQKIFLMLERWHKSGKC